MNSPTGVNQPRHRQYISFQTVLDSQPVSTAEVFSEGGGAAPEDLPANVTGSFLPRLFSEQPPHCRPRATVFERFLIISSNQGVCNRNGVLIKIKEMVGLVLEKNAATSQFNFLGKEPHSFEGKSRDQNQQVSITSSSQMAFIYFELMGKQPVSKQGPVERTVQTPGRSYR